jgi:hypothetical protein
MLLHVAWFPVLSTGQVVLSPGVHDVVHTCSADIEYRWQVIDMHWVLSVHGS